MVTIELIGIQYSTVCGKALDRLLQKQNRSGPFCRATSEVNRPKSEIQTFADFRGLEFVHHSEFPDPKYGVAPAINKCYIYTVWSYVSICHSGVKTAKKLILHAAHL